MQKTNKRLALNSIINNYNFAQKNAMTSLIFSLTYKLFANLAIKSVFL